MPAPVSSEDIARFLGLPIMPAGAPVVTITRPRPAARAEPGALVFLKAAYAAQAAALDAVGALFVIAEEGLAGQLTCPHVLTPDPRLAFAKVLQRFFYEKPPAVIEPTARIAPSAKIGKDVGIGHAAIIGDDVEIGDGTIIRAYVSIAPRTKIGRNCLIKTHTVIGEEGFGFEFDKDGTPIRIPHLGRVIIGDGCEIGALNGIARGTLDDTVLGNHVKTDDHVFIAHNVQVGDNTVIIAGAEVSGSVKIGRDVWIGPQSCIRDQLRIGDRALVGIGAVVQRDVAENAVVTGNPALEIRKKT